MATKPQPPQPPQPSPTPQPPSFTIPHHPSLTPYTLSIPSHLTHHAHNTYTHIGTGALVLTPTTTPPKILLLQRSPRDSMPNLWESPGGGCDPTDPNILSSVARELWEEAGLRAVYIGKTVGAPHLFMSQTGNRICKFNFCVRVRGDADVKVNPEEHSRFVWASREEVVAKRVGDVELDFTSPEQESVLLEAFNHIEEYVDN